MVRQILNANCLRDVLDDFLFLRSPQAYLQVHIAMSFRDRPLKQL